MLATLLAILTLLKKMLRTLPGKIIRHVPMPEPNIINGMGSRSQVGRLCRGSDFGSVLLVTDKTISSLGFHDAIVQSLEKEGVKYAVFNEIDSEPTMQIIDAGRRAAVACEAQCIVALGGGSVMDASKMIAAGMALKRVPTKLLGLKFLFVPGQTLPMINIPTTAGTGAETTVGAIVTNPRRGSKKATVIVGLDVQHVVLDSELTLHAPAAVTAACGIDALSHGLEGLLADIRNEDDDIYKSRECVRLVMHNLPILLEHPDDVEARQAMCQAAYYGGNAINKQLAGYVHAFAHAIGAKFHIPHGQAIALSLIPVCSYQLFYCSAKLAALARYCGVAQDEQDEIQAAKRLLNEIEQLIKRCNIPPIRKTLSRHEVEKLALKVERDAINYSQPVTFNSKEIKHIIRIICE